MNELIRKQITAELDEAEVQFCHEHSYGDVVLLYDDFLEDTFKSLSEKYSMDIKDITDLWIDHTVEQL